MVRKGKMLEIVQEIRWNQNFLEIMRGFLRKSEKLKNPIFDKIANFSKTVGCPTWKKFS